MSRRECRGGLRGVGCVHDPEWGSGRCCADVHSKCLIGGEFVEVRYREFGCGVCEVVAPDMGVSSDLSQGCGVSIFASGLKQLGDALE